MQYVRSITGSVGSAWNSINPATLSGAIDVVVVEQEDGSLACSPFHIRFGKFSLLRPSEKKVDFMVNEQKLHYPMKLGDGGEAFFVFETHDSVPEALQTSPLVSPASSPELRPPPMPSALQEPDVLDLEDATLSLHTQLPLRRGHSRSTTEGLPIPNFQRTPYADLASPSQHAAPVPNATPPPPLLPPHGLDRTSSDSALITTPGPLDLSETPPAATKSARAPSPPAARDRPPSPPTSEQEDARTRAMALSKKLWTSNISNHVTDSGDLMLDMTGFKTGNLEALQAEGVARQLLSEELDGPYDIGALIGADEKGNIWIYSSEDAKDAANQRIAAATSLGAFHPGGYASTDAISDPGYHSDDAGSVDSHSAYPSDGHHRRDSDSALGMPSQPSSPGRAVAGDPNKNYAKTLRLTSDQLKTIDLKPGANTMSFTVNRATCTATLWYWRHDVPIVISDIDGTITKSDVWGHVLNKIGRDWTHQGVAKLYTEIASNGYNFLYLTSRSVGQADTTRAYLKGVLQEGYTLPPGPVILSPDRTIAALRREVYLRKPEVFKMACLRDIMSLFSGHGGAQNTMENAIEAGLKPLNTADMPGGLGAGRGKAGSPFYAGFGNRLTDALSYRSVNIPSTRIFTINTDSEVSLDLLSLNNYKTAYSSMREIVDHYFPPVGLLVKGGGEEFTDFNYWRSTPLDIADFTDSENEDDAIDAAMRGLEQTETRGTHSVLSEDEAGDDMMDSYLSDPGRPSLDQSVAGTLDDDEDALTNSILDEDEDGDDEEEGEEEDDDDDDEDEVEGVDENEDEDLVSHGSPPRTPPQLTPRIQQEQEFSRTPRQQGVRSVPTLDEESSSKGEAAELLQLDGDVEVMK